MSGRKTLALAAAALLAVPAASGQASGDACFLVADNNGIHFDADILTSIDKRTGVESEVGLTGTLAVEAIAFHPFTNELFAVDGGLLGTIDGATGTFSPVGWLGTAYGSQGPVSAGDVDGLSFDPVTGELYGSVRRDETDVLVQIDPASGRVVDNTFGTDVSYLPITYGSDDVNVDDIAVSPLSGDLYAITSDGNASVLVVVDRQSGIASTMASLPVPDLEGLSFDPDGRLFATPGNDAPGMVEIHLASGAVSTFAAIGIGGNRDYEAVTCMAHNVVSSSSESLDLPFEISLLPAYPNPFNPTTSISFALPQASQIRLTMFDMLGREIELMADGYWAAGTHTVRFDAGDLPSGLYMYRLEAPDFVTTRMVTLLR